MASNYVNTTPAEQLDKKTLNKIVWRSYNLQGSFNYQRMQANGWLYMILPGLIKIHGEGTDDLKASMAHNLDFFNTHPFLVTLVAGIVLSLEQNKLDINTIRAVRVAAMGPLGGIGDALFWLTLVPITAGITANMAVEGNMAAPIIFFVILMAAQHALRYFLMHWSYKQGEQSINLLTAHAKEFTHAASLLGVFVVGVLTSNYGATTTALVIRGIEIQGVLDGICPKLLPLGITLLLYVLLKKGATPIKCILGILVVGILGGLVGFF